MENKFSFIDYSQYRAWMKCPWKWYERYVAGFEKPFPKDRQRDDNLCIGSLYHEGLENWYRRGRVEIRPEVLSELNPTPEAYTLIQECLNGYVQTYPSIPWKVKQLEMPLVKPLANDLHMLAKVDQYFYVKDTLMVESGIPGERLTLQPGYWVQENKTKAMNIDRGKYFRGWTMNMQADFQLLTLTEHLHSQGITAPVNGVLVNVCEKPKEYTPERTCKNKECGVKIPLASYLPAPPGQHTFTSGGKKPKTTTLDASKCGVCPFCGNVQELKAYESTVDRRPVYYRLITTRTEEELQESAVHIEYVALAMEMVRQLGRHSIPPNRESCVDTIFGDCEYYKNHKYGVDVSEDDDLVKRDATKYVELYKILSLPEAA